MKKIRMMFNMYLTVVIGVMVLCVLASCSKDGDGGGGMNPFDGGGSGGGSSSSLVGKWTSISCTGTVGYSSSTVSVSLTTAVNSNITGYELEGVSYLQFEASGKLSLYDLGTLYEQGTYTLKGNTLTLKNSRNETLNFKITINGNEFTLEASGTEIAALVAWAIGEAVLRYNGYAGMTQTGTEVTVANLTIKFKKL